MANNFQKRPWEIDTANANSPLYFDQWKGKIRLTATGGADTDSVIIQDKDGNELIRFNHDGTRDNYTSDGVVPASGYANGLKVPTLSTGKLLIDYE